MNVFHDISPHGEAIELQPGASLNGGQFTISRFLNSGGFGITYLARDSLDRTVVVKECFQDTYCRRSGQSVAVSSAVHTPQFSSLVSQFVKEAKALSKLVHPNIVGVHQIFEDNCTAYMALDYVDGCDLLDIIEDPEYQLSPEMVKTWLHKLLEAVAFVHEHDVLHRDISPDNILINQDFEPVLIDFGAAREEAGRTSRVVSAMRVVKDGYSPQEFYVSGSCQNASSDLYALAASFYHLISGQAPPSSQSRMMALVERQPDPYVPLYGCHQGYANSFLHAIDVCLNIRSDARLQSAQNWLDLIETDEVPATPHEDFEWVRDEVKRISDEFREGERQSIPVAHLPLPLKRASFEEEEDVVAPKVTVSFTDLSEPVMVFKEGEDDPEEKVPKAEKPKDDGEGRPIWLIPVLVLAFLLGGFGNREMSFLERGSAMVQVMQAQTPVSRAEMARSPLRGGYAE